MELAALGLEPLLQGALRQCTFERDASGRRSALELTSLGRLGSKVEGTDVLINLTDPGWCRTDLGGQQAPNAPESAIPGIVVGVFVDDGKSGRNLGAQHFAGMKLEEAVQKAEAEFDSPYRH